MYQLKNIFDVFLPQLLLYPNPTDPLNGEAAGLYNQDQTKYDAHVRDLTKKYGKIQMSDSGEEEKKEDDDDEMQVDKGSELSETSLSPASEDDNMSASAPSDQEDDP